MFSKKCKGCHEKISKDDNFCAHCGFSLKEKKSREEEFREYGMLGRNDFEGEFAEGFPIGLNGLFNSLMKEMRKELKGLNAEPRVNPNLNKKIKKTKKMHIKSPGLSININFSDGSGRVLGNQIEEEVEEKPLPKNILSEERAREVSKLPKEEAKANVRRMSNKIVYEIELPGVKSMKDVIIQKLENSLEIKAFSDKKSYFKLLPVNFPVSGYRLLKSGKLILELIDEE